MCEKVKGCNRQIDECLISDILGIQILLLVKSPNLVIISSCCGHGKYKPTIVVRDKKTNKCFEWFSKILLHDYNPKFDKRHNTYYKKDKQGFYYIPELIQNAI